ncbi:Medium-chain specific acyl-CoA dehydrogenase mitochondrial [Dissostichus eleginoides]|uniref:Medium-chain specific acyl-CoA dehydrogenase mitochondrial n=1 Tax=Dissostichus eleginoides TaxID=100907 RepID=A0AAD9EQI1_DISEL|nr:Medium-chain specific acyl-CoA dehydrogenase mitochondrial [Dissostichus eleginoides]
MGGVVQLSHLFMVWSLIALGPGYGYPYYEDPSYQQPGSGSATPQLNAQHAPAVEGLINGSSTDWGQENLENPLEFPLSPNYPPIAPANSQQSPVQSRPTNGMPAHPAVVFTREAAFEPAPSSTSNVVKFPSVESWQPKPASNGSSLANQNINLGSRESDSRNIPHLVFEDVFQYPSENIDTSNTAGGYGQAAGQGTSTGSAPPPKGPSFPKNPANERAQPAKQNYGKMPKPVSSPRKALAPQRVSEPFAQSYISQSRNSYQRAKYRQSNTRYSPRVSWICLLLCDFTVGLPIARGYGYPYYEDPSYQQPGSGSATPQLNAQRAPAVEGLINGGSTDWGQENLENPLEFPLSPNYPPIAPANSQQSPVQSRTTNGMPAHPAVVFTREAAFEPAPSSTSNVVKFPSVESWQPKPASNGSSLANQNINLGSRESDSRNIPHLVFEDVFQYPSENIDTSNTAGGYGQAGGQGTSTGSAPPPKGPSFPKNPANERAQPAKQNYGKMPKPVSSPRKALAPQRVSEPFTQSYISQSRNSYQRAKYRQSNTRTKW